MGESIFMSLVLICFGAYALIRNVGMYQDEAKLIQYLEKSTKAKLWVKKLGMPKTVALSKKIFLPLGLLMSLVLVIAGIYNLVILL